MKLLFKEITHGSTDWVTAVQLREKILREPLGSKFSDLELEEEKNHIQIAGFMNQLLIATTVLVPEGIEMKMQRVVVANNFRSTGIGSQMMHFCEKIAIEQGVKTMYCHARNTAVNFYLKNGYTKVGSYFDEDGIPHLKMTKSL